MKFALFPGCKIAYFLPSYGFSTRALLKALGVDLVDMDFTCCGYPVRNFHSFVFLYTAIRNLALAEKEDLDILTPCKCCFGTLKKAEFIWKESSPAKQEISHLLKQEGLIYEGKIRIHHLLSVLFHEIGLKKIKEKIIHPFKDLKIATHYGCHALRPSQIVQFDNPVNPTKFDQLVEVTGAESISWSKKLLCCGNPLWGNNNELSLNLMETKLRDGRKAGAHYICVACTYCQIQFDTVQNMMIQKQGGNLILPSILYPQLLGLSMGLDREALRISRKEAIYGYL